jgi:hypothetical protein
MRQCQGIPACLQAMLRLRAILLRLRATSRLLGPTQAILLATQRLAIQCLRHLLATILCREHRRCPERQGCHLLRNQPQR